jgi:Domain of unknown function (DUF1931)
MPVMGLPSSSASSAPPGGVDVDRDDIKRYLDFVNDALYDLLLIGQATAKANVRDVILPWDLPVTKGLQESVHAFERLEEEIELRPILESLAARGHRWMPRWPTIPRPGSRCSSAASASPWPGRSRSSTPSSRPCTPEDGNARSNSSGCSSEPDTS